VAIGGEFQVNAETLGDQRYLAIGGAARDGSFVVVWESNAGQAPDQTEIKGRRFNSIGQGLSSEFQVNTFSTDEQLLPAVSGTPDGTFVVVWQSYGNSDGAGSGVRGQRFDSNGGRIGGEFEVNTYTTYNQGGPAVDSAPDGSFVVVWDAYRSQATNYDVFARRFGSDGKSHGRRIPGQQPDDELTSTHHCASAFGRIPSWSCGAATRGSASVGTTSRGNSTTSRANDGRRVPSEFDQLRSALLSEAAEAWRPPAECLAGRVPPDSDGSGIGAQLYELPPLPCHRPRASGWWSALTVIAICAKVPGVVRSCSLNASPAGRSAAALRRGWNGKAAEQDCTDHRWSVGDRSLPRGEIRSRGRARGHLLTSTPTKARRRHRLSATRRASWTQDVTS
jgi:hypothetical protein